MKLRTLFRRDKPSRYQLERAVLSTSIELHEADARIDELERRLAAWDDWADGIEAELKQARGRADAEKLRADQAEERCRQLTHLVPDEPEPVDFTPLWNAASDIFPVKAWEDPMSITQRFAAIREPLELEGAVNGS